MEDHQPQSPCDWVKSSPLPQTPRAPIEPPQRRSSLAFSAKKPTVASPDMVHDDQHVPEPLQTSIRSEPNIGKKRTLPSPSILQDSSQLERVLQTAKGALHRDMYAASSPASSIESRMNLDPTTPLQARYTPASKSREWRYSSAPQNLALASIDVREPLPSPTLPEISHEDVCSAELAAEPVSSGFVSPSHDSSGCEEHPTASDNPVDKCRETEMQEVAAEEVGLVANFHLAGETELDQPLHRLQFHDEKCDDNLPQISKSAGDNHTRLPSTPADVVMRLSPTNSIYLSEAAEAAAESAKARRNRLRAIFFDEDERPEVSRSRDEDRTDESSDLSMICPNPDVHRSAPFIPCPEPSMHTRSPSPYEQEVSLFERQRNLMQNHGPMIRGHRATATGSPMPFSRVRPVYLTSSSDQQSLRASLVPHHGDVQLSTLNEDFQPNWYYAQENARPPPVPTYSFSTAASKVKGSDQAPDSRTRDSYNTDTLTSLPLPTNRYRKTGIAAELPSRGLGRYYQRPSSSGRTPSTRFRPSSRQTYAGGEEVRFRSSPPRGSTPDYSRPIRRKRAIDDSFLAGNGFQHGRNPHRGLRLHASNDTMRMDDQVQAAVRRSVFGTHSPEILRQARQGIQELSPNVQMYRKGTHEYQHLRKKRRPSYWDNDLKEVRESPAGRGGVRSPVSAQESMRAEFEEASQREGETGMIVDAVDQEQT